MKHILWSIPLLLTLLGCGTVSDLPPGYTLGPQNAEGLAIVSLTLSGVDLGAVERFEYRLREAPPDDAQESVRRSPYFESARQHARWLQDRQAQGPAATYARLIVKGQGLAEPLDVVESGKAIGRVAVLRLPAGAYELHGWRMVIPNQYGGNVFTPGRAFAYRFRVEAGRATYLGNVNLLVTGQDTYRIAVANRADRDLGLLARKIASLRGEDIVYQPGELRP